MRAAVAPAAPAHFARAGACARPARPLMCGDAFVRGAIVRSCGFSMNGWTPLLFACFAQEIALVSVLLGRGADPWIKAS